MGYYVMITDAWATLSADKFDIAYERLVELNDHEEWKRGGSYSGGAKLSSHYSWMDEDYPSKLKTVQEVLEAVGYQTSIIGGDLDIMGYDNKTGCEDIFVWAIADLFNSNSYIEWRGEEGNQWRWEFGGGEPLRSCDASIVWGQPQEMEPHKYGLIPVGSIPVFDI